MNLKKYNQEHRQNRIYDIGKMILGGTLLGASAYALYPQLVANCKCIIGKFFNDQMDGEVHIYDDGSSYKGELRNGLRHGFRIYQWLDEAKKPAKYEGSFKDGKFDGKGTLTKTEKEYSGKFKNNKLNGLATCTLSNGDIVKAIYSEDKRQGNGIYKWFTGERYIGQFRDDKMNGQGTFNWPNEDVYFGAFKDGKITGQGTHFFADGVIDEGNFEKGKFHGHGKRFWPDGDVYEGAFEDGEMNGKGILLFADGVNTKGIS